MSVFSFLIWGLAYTWFSVVLKWVGLQVCGNSMLISLTTLNCVEDGSHNIFTPYFLVEQGESLSFFINIFILIPQMCWLTVMAYTS